MAKNRFSSLIPLGAFLGALFIHGMAFALIYEGGSWKASSPPMTYAEITIVHEKTESLKWVEAPKQTEEKKERSYSYTKPQAFEDNQEEDVFMRLYKNESDFLLEKLAYETKILAYAQDIQSTALSPKKEARQPNLKTNSKKSKATRPSSFANQKTAQGKKQSAYCKLGGAVSSQKPKKPAHIKILVNAKGRVQKALLTSSSGLPSFDKAALRMAHRAQCRPEIIKGKAKAAYVHIRISPNR